MSIKSRIQEPRPLSCCRRATSLFLAFCVLILSIAGVSPQLHEELHCSAHHEDCESSSNDRSDTSGSEGHVCAISLLQGGVILGGGVERIIVVRQLLISIVDFPIAKFVESGRWFFQARAPPVEV